MSRRCDSRQGPSVGLGGSDLSGSWSLIVTAYRVRLRGAYWNAREHFSISKKRDAGATAWMIGVVDGDACLRIRDRVSMTVCSSVA